MYNPKHHTMEEKNGKGRGRGRNTYKCGTEEEYNPKTSFRSSTSSEQKMAAK